MLPLCDGPLQGNIRRRYDESRNSNPQPLDHSTGAQQPQTKKHKKLGKHCPLLIPLVTLMCHNPELSQLGC